ncbi:MAG: DUF2272 domain-containing protein [Alphaproteobacteria bacterium]|nr:DUF2272 domain-containing protein [Alphaproteobacteria bacterium]
MPSRTAVLVLVLAGLGACTLAERCPDPSLRPARAPLVQPRPEAEARLALVELAYEEWRRFGQPTITWRGPGSGERQAGLSDRDARGAAMVAGYWRTLGHDWPERRCATPWSATFVSQLMIRAGVGAREFEPAAAHWIYLRAIAAQAQDPTARFRIVAPDRIAPRPGDLICHGRGIGRRGFDAANIPEGAPLHCDLVVANRDGWLDAIGGNVSGAVTLSRRPVDAAGRLPAASDQPWFAVVSNRLGETAAPPRPGPTS